jgi:hypothetical protein
MNTAPGIIPINKIKREECGNCAHWMIKSQCEPERNGFKRTYHMTSCQYYKIDGNYYARSDEDGAA